jgi:hypothetical protein
MCPGHKWLGIEGVTTHGRETKASAAEGEITLTLGPSPDGRGVRKDR